jgi:hypothetical protein
LARIRNQEEPIKNLTVISYQPEEQDERLSEGTNTNLADKL